MRHGRVDFGLGVFARGNSAIVPRTPAASTARDARCGDRVVDSARASATTATPAGGDGCTACALDPRLRCAAICSPAGTCRQSCGDGSLDRRRGAATTAPPRRGDGCDANCAGRARLDLPRPVVLARRAAAIAITAGDETCDDGDTDRRRRLRRALSGRRSATVRSAPSTCGDGDARRRRGLRRRRGTLAGDGCDPRVLPGRRRLDAAAAPTTPSDVPAPSRCGDGLPAGD
jgi:hypothetical protein